MDLSSTLLGLAALVAATWFLSTFSVTRRRPTLPPGPARKPIIGNLLDVPTGKDWLTYANWAKTYGDIISLTVFGQTVVVLNSVHDVRELLVARATNYSERTRTTMIELAGWADAGGITDNADEYHVPHLGRGNSVCLAKVWSPESVEAPDACYRMAL